MQAVVTEALAAREWLAAGRFTAADLYVGSSLHFGVAFGILPKDGPIGDYVKRLTARPAFERANALETGFIAERQRAEG
jgi:glutathione S-transferase